MGRIVFALLTALMLTACRTKREEAVDLRGRITAARTGQYCHVPDACFNPHILVLEGGYDVTTFEGNRPQHAMVRPEGLRDHLQSLPMSAWPQGPMILISPSDDVIDGSAIKKNLDEAERVCHSLGIDVEFRPGG